MYDPRYEVKKSMVGLIVALVVIIVLLGYLIVSGALVSEEAMQKAQEQSNALAIASAEGAESLAEPQGAEEAETMPEETERKPQAQEPPAEALPSIVTAVTKGAATAAYLDDLQSEVDKSKSEIERLKAELAKVTAERDMYQEAYETYEAFLDELLVSFEEF